MTDKRAGRSALEEAVVDRGDDELTAAALAGDRLAWDALARRHTPRVRAGLLARGIRLDRANDLVQETWARLLEKRRAGELADLRLPGLAIRQATFLARDAERRRRREAGEELADERPDGTAAADERIISREELAHAEEAFRACGEAERRTFLYLYQNPQKTYGEVAVDLALSEQRVKQVAYEVRRRLRLAAFEERDGRST
jgi:RNA polymerase sigma factor (sigma-70 family)